MKYVLSRQLLNLKSWSNPKVIHEIINRADAIMLTEQSLSLRSSTAIGATMRSWRGASLPPFLYVSSSELAD